MVHEVVPARIDGYAFLDIVHPAVELAVALALVPHPVGLALERLGLGGV
jgi:hypothetical protein